MIVLISALLAVSLCAPAAAAKNPAVLSAKERKSLEALLRKEKYPELKLGLERVKRRHQELRFSHDSAVLTILQLQRSWSSAGHPSALLQEIADLFMELGEHSSAEHVYGAALKTAPPALLEAKLRHGLAGALVHRDDEDAASYRLAEEQFLAAARRKPCASWNRPWRRRAAARRRK